MIDDLRDDYLSIDDVVGGLTSIEAQCLTNRDLRGAFVTAYLHITRAIQRAHADQVFSDAEWVERYLVSFGNLYRRALLAYEEERTESVPKSWQIAFDAARDGGGFVIQHLTLGINAHINHDLPLALVEIGIDPTREAKYSDHTLVNTILAEATDAMKRAVAESYAPILMRIDRLSGRYGEELPNFSIPKAREHAWSMAVALSATRFEHERRMIEQALDEQAGVLARLILSSPTRHPSVVAGVSKAKRLDRFLTRLSRFPVVGRMFNR